MQRTQTKDVVEVVYESLVQATTLDGALSLKATFLKRWSTQLHWMHPSRTGDSLSYFSSVKEDDDFARSQQYFIIISN